MLSTLSYLFFRLFYRIVEFLRHWYVKSGKLYSNFVLNKLQEMDRTLAWKITFKHLFEPLYKDYSVVGYILGFFFRSFRLFVGGLVYSVVFFFAIAAYLVWLALPPFLLLKAMGI